MSEPTIKNIASLIRSRRRGCGMTLERLAESAGISKTYLWELENDEAGSKRPSVDVMVRIARALGTSLPSLIDMPPTSHAADLRTLRIAMATLCYLHASEVIPQEELDVVRVLLGTWMSRMGGEATS